MEGGRLAAGGPDLARNDLAHLGPPRPEHHREAIPGQGARRLGSDARRGAGDHRRPSVRVRLEARHQRRVTVVGRTAKPRTLTECTRTTPLSSMP